MGGLSTKGKIRKKINHYRSPSKLYNKQDWSTRAAW